ncbi:glycosyl transferase [Bacteroides fragilis]|nr:glycosyl transferase [Bacteroides fragilis]MCE9303391.1 glycosyl transferase [Bacteroides fragilis]
MEKYIIYNLTRRGLFSEILNLALAKSYADFMGMTIIVNTRNWNARIKNGWNDYFLPTLPCINCFCTSQVYVTGRKKKIGLRDWFHSPSRVMLHYVLCVANQICQKRNKSFLLNDEIYDKMRSNDFVCRMPKLDIFIQYKKILTDLFVFNDDIKRQIDSLKSRIGLPEKYIGVHIRRGDKILTKEMDDIDIEQYIYEIINKSNMSMNIYIATDDHSVISIIQERLHPLGFSIYYNIYVSQEGFSEKKYNRKRKSDKFIDTLYTLLDVCILMEATFFIGTYSSNLSRIIPCFIDESRCKSLDIDWNIVF